MIVCASVEVIGGKVVNASSPSFRQLIERLIAKYGAEELFRRIGAA